MSERSPSRVHLTLVRHGQTTWNDAGIVQGQRDDASLTTLGRQQALDAAHALRTQTFDAVISSDLTRARETAAIIADVLGLVVETSSALRERSFGEAEGHPVADLDHRVTGIEAHHVVDADARPLGGESMNDVYRRTTDFVAALTLQRAGQRLLLISHGGAIHTIRAFVRGVGMPGLAWDPVENCSLWPLDVELD